MDKGKKQERLGSRPSAPAGSVTQRGAAGPGRAVTQQASSAAKSPRIVAIKSVASSSRSSSSPEVERARALSERKRGLESKLQATRSGISSRAPGVRQAGLAEGSKRTDPPRVVSVRPRAQTSTRILGPAVSKTNSVQQESNASTRVTKLTHAQSSIPAPRAALSNSGTSRTRADEGPSRAVTDEGQVRSTEETRALVQALEDRENLIQALEGQVDALQLSLKAEEEKRSLLQEQVAVSLREVEQLTEEKTDAKEQLRSCESERDAALLDLDQLMHSAQLSDERTPRSTLAATAPTSSKYVQTTLTGSDEDEALERLKKEEHEASSLKAQMEDLKSELDMVRLEKEEAELELEDAREALSRYESSPAGLAEVSSRKCNELEKALRELHELHESTKNSYCMTIEKLEEENQGLREFESEAERALDLAAEVEDLRAQLADLRADHGTADEGTSNAAHLERIVEDLSDKNMDLEERCASLLEQVHALEAYKDMADEMEEDYRAAEQQYESELATLRDRVADLEAALAAAADGELALRARYDEEAQAHPPANVASNGDGEGRLSSTSGSQDAPEASAHALAPESLARDMERFQRKYVEALGTTSALRARCDFALYILETGKIMGAARSRVERGFSHAACAALSSACIQKATDPTLSMQVRVYLCIWASASALLRDTLGSEGVAGAWESALPVAHALTDPEYTTDYDAVVNHYPVLVDLRQELDRVQSLRRASWDAVVSLLKYILTREKVAEDLLLFTERVQIITPEHSNEDVLAMCVETREMLSQHLSIGKSKHLQHNISVKNADVVSRAAAVSSVDDIVKPLQRTMDHVSELQARTSASEREIAALQKEVATLREREVEIVAQKEILERRLGEHSKGLVGATVSSNARSAASSGATRGHAGTAAGEDSSSVHIKLYEEAYDQAQEEIALLQKQIVALKTKLANALGREVAQSASVSPVSHLARTRQRVVALESALATRVLCAPVARRNDKAATLDKVCYTLQKASDMKCAYLVRGCEEPAISELSLQESFLQILWFLTAPPVLFCLSRKAKQ